MLIKEFENPYPKWRPVKVDQSSFQAGLAYTSNRFHHAVQKDGLEEGFEK